MRIKFPKIQTSFFYIDLLNALNNDRVIEFFVWWAIFASGVFRSYFFGKTAVKGNHHHML
jgi:hypothetical protein